MHIKKNFNLSKLISLGLIISLISCTLPIYATDISAVISQVKESVVSSMVNDINNSDNIGVSLSVKGEIANISENYLTIKDDSGDGLIFLENIPIEIFEIGQNIYALGIVSQDNGSDNLILIVNDSQNISILDIEEPDIDDSDDKNDDNNQDGNNNVNNGNHTGGTNLGNGNENGNASSTKPGNTTITLTNNTQNSSTATNKKTIKSRMPVNISYELSSNQWKTIEEHQANGTIKLIDLNNNKIKIVRIYEELGDKIWIVNDPRMLDKETEESIYSIGKDVIKAVNYLDYEISNSKWSIIYDDVLNGDAKIKIDNDNNLKVIYNKIDKKDTTLTISKK